MYCTKCGATVQEGAAFCRHCGQPVGSAATTAMEGAAEEATIPAGVPSADRNDVTFPLGAPPPLAPYGAPISTGIAEPPVAYAGFWLRVVAYLIDSAIMGVVFGAIVIAILVATVGVRFFRESLHTRALYWLRGATVSYEVNALLDSRGRAWNHFCPNSSDVVATWLYFALMESSVHQGDARKNGPGALRYGSARAPISFGRATGRFFAKIITGSRSAFHWLHHGGLYGKKAGAARYDRGLPGVEENLAKNGTPKRPSHSVRDGPARRVIRCGFVR